MQQLAVYRNSNAATSEWAPYLCILQHDILDGLDTRVVAPLVRLEAFGRPISVLNPVFSIEGNEVVLSTAELAGVSTAALGPYVTSLSEKRDEVIAALDLLFTGF